MITSQKTKGQTPIKSIYLLAVNLITTLAR